eukprot:1385956-Ditylum_brightwellii.AAC.1
MHSNGTFHSYNQCHNQVVWFQSSSDTTLHLPAAAVITSAQTFGSLLVCQAHIQHIQVQAQEQTAPAVKSTTSFAAYINQQPNHIKRLLGNLHADNVDPEYWTQAISDGIVTKATDDSVAQKKGYFV